MATATLAISPVGERPLRLRTRPDLTFVRQGGGVIGHWIACDAIEQKHFHLTEREYALLQRLDGKQSLASLARALEQTFAPARVTVEELQEYLASLFQAGLLLSDTPAQGTELLQRRAEQRWDRRIQGLLGILAIRLPAVSSHRLLEPLYSRLLWVFSRWTACAVIALVTSAIVMLMAHHDEVFARLPDISELLSSSELPWWIVALVGTKILHELGHAVAARHWTGKCPPLGCMLLAFTPALYCDVSDAWRLPSLMARVAIVAAGMVAELAFAAVCAWLWWLSVPGLLNSLCLKVMVVCSVGTILLNGNPLLRYDGYYILSDLVGVPNLASVAANETKRRFARWCLGMDLPRSGSRSDRPALLLSYYLASTLYRLLIVGTVLFGLWRVMDRYDLRPIGGGIIAITLLAMAWPGASAMQRYLRQPAASKRVAPLRVAATGLCVCALLAMLFLVPFPMRVRAPAVIELQDGQGVYVTSPGSMQARVQPGDRVSVGDTLAQLRSSKLETQIAQLETDRAVWQSRLNSLSAAQLSGQSDGSQLPGARASLGDIESQLTQLKQEAERLTLRAPTSGVVVAPSPIPEKSPAANESELSTWKHSPLDATNDGCWLERGTLFCYVGDDTAHEAILNVSQDDVDLVSPGQTVRLVTKLHPGTVIWGTIREIARQDVAAIPPELTGSEMPGKMDARGISHPLDTWYQARVALENPPVALLPGARCTAQIVVAPRPLAEQWARAVRQTFGF